MRRFPRVNTAHEPRWRPARSHPRLPPLRAAPRGARTARHEHSRIAARREHGVGGDRAAAVFRNKRFSIHIENGGKSLSKLTCNGKAYPSGFIPVEDFKDENRVEIVML